MKNADFWMIPIIGFCITMSYVVSWVMKAVLVSLGIVCQ
jgi:hypothetical protein